MVSFVFPSTLYFLTLPLSSLSSSRVLLNEEYLNVKYTTWSVANYLLTLKNAVFVIRLSALTRPNSSSAILLSNFILNNWGFLR